ncbi:branched-chain amino acid ABC transporter permease [Geminicoccus roseus]|uniref:branched-chain amino acid ABC transporter permease n=1 Tax=Geminicoccus roseus TaxID=404900 RepID=UPI0003FCB1B3|nr:branched-chain amino acid ABC transporter permease [Geminicoccus roseus]
MSRSDRGHLITALVVLALLASLPFVADSRYVIGQVILALFYAIVASQWNLLFGFAGVFSLGQMALFAFGGYVTAMLGFYLDWSMWLAMPVGAVATVLISLAIGLACLRLAGAYVALLTLAVAQVMYLLIVTDTDCFIMQGATCRQFTGGAVGFARFGDLGTRAIFKGDYIIANYAIVVALFAVTMAFTWAVIRSPLGLAFQALRDNPGCAVARGINRFSTQLLVFGASAFFTGLAGGLYAAHFQAIGPNVLSLSTLMFIIAIAVVGGIGKLWGPLVGAVILVLADEALREVGGDYRTLGLGLIIAAAMVLMPRGVIGLAEGLAARFRSTDTPARLAETPGSSHV